MIKYLVALLCQIGFRQILKGIQYDFSGKEMHKISSCYVESEILTIKTLIS